MKKSKRYGPVGSNYNSKKYYAMHKANISEGLRRYWFRKKAYKAVENGTATPEQQAFVDEERRMSAYVFAVLTLIFLGVLIYNILTK